MYAIVDIGGQQFKVEKDQKLYVNCLDGDTGSSVDFDRVLLIDDNGKVSVGTPLVKDTVVTAKIVDHIKGDKIKVFKKKRRKGYRVLNGHRQYLTELVIEGIGEKKAAKKPESKAESKTTEKTAPKAGPSKEQVKPATGKEDTETKAEKESKVTKPKAEKPADAPKKSTTTKKQTTGAKKSATSSKSKVTKKTAAKSKPAAKKETTEKKAAPKKDNTKEE